VHVDDVSDEIIGDEETRIKEPPEKLQDLIYEEQESELQLDDLSDVDSSDDGTGEPTAVRRSERLRRRDRTRWLPGGVKATMLSMSF
jgi:hypothetical protein